MSAGKKIIIGLLSVIGLIGVYMVLTSDRFQTDPYSVILGLVVAGFVIYLYFMYSRSRG